jgi:superfamily II DNA or RNA helicase
MEAIRQELRRGHCPVVLVPGVALLDQWTSELREHLGDLRIRVHPCGAKNKEWNNLLGPWLRQTEENRVVVSTITTASSPSFLGHLKRTASNLFVVADEVHRLGAPQARELLDVSAVARLGLSATPERAGDTDGTKALFRYFNGIVDTFTLQDALNANPPILTPYTYEPHVVHLSDSEQSQWNELSKQIARLIARYGDTEVPPDQVLQHPRLKRLFIRRARVIKKAAAKIALARSVLSDHYSDGQRWLVYCEDQDQLREVVTELLDADIPVTEYHSAMSGDRSATLDYFAINGGVVVSIRCLDEGVDIPVATHALVLASSRNPREFIQRRGRVLRRAEGKPYAEIYDTIVVPEPPLERSGRSMILGELARAAEFAKGAFTKASVGVLYQAFADAGGDLSDPDLSGGFEADDD